MVFRLSAGAPSNLLIFQLGSWDGNQAFGRVPCRQIWSETLKVRSDHYFHLALAC